MLHSSAPLVVLVTLLDPILVDEALEQGVSLESLMRAKVLNEWALELNAAADEYRQVPARLDAMRGKGRRRRSAVRAQIEIELLEQDIETWESVRDELTAQMESEMRQTNGS